VKKISAISRFSLHFSSRMVQLIEIVLRSGLYFAFTGIYDCCFPSVKKSDAEKMDGKDRILF